MSHLINVKKSATISFVKVDFETPIKVAKEMQNEIIAFFKENPDGEIRFEFGGFARLSSDFANALFEGGLLNEYKGKMTTFGMHIFDGIKLNEAMEQ